MTEIEECGSCGKEPIDEIYWCKSCADRIWSDLDDYLTNPRRWGKE